MTIPAEIIPANVLKAVERQGEALDKHFASLIGISTATQQEIHDLATAIRYDHENKKAYRGVKSNGEHPWMLLVAMGSIMFGLLTPLYFNLQGVHDKVRQTESRVHEENSAIIKLMQRDNDREESMVRQLAILETNTAWIDRIQGNHVNIVDRWPRNPQAKP
tara:strand:+ start:793 stop:1278 length:486 start_codon:yes stop_codon:yes gene_type:complete